MSNTKSKIPQRVNDGRETGSDRPVHPNFQRFSHERDSVQVRITEHMIKVLRCDCSAVRKPGQHTVHRHERKCGSCVVSCQCFFPAGIFFPS